MAFQWNVQAQNIQGWNALVNDCTINVRTGKRAKGWNVLTSQMGDGVLEAVRQMKQLVIDLNDERARVSRRDLTIKMKDATINAQSTSLAQAQLQNAEQNEKISGLEQEIRAQKDMKEELAGRLSSMKETAKLNEEFAQQKQQTIDGLYTFIYDSKEMLKNAPDYDLFFASATELLDDEASPGVKADRVVREAAKLAAATMPFAGLEDRLNPPNYESDVDNVEPDTDLEYTEPNASPYNIRF